MNAKQYFYRLMSTALKNTGRRIGIKLSIAVYTILAFIIGSIFHYFYVGPDSLIDEWKVWVIFTLLGGIGTWCVAFIFSCVTAPFQIYCEQEQAHREFQKKLEAESQNFQKKLSKYEDRDAKVSIINGCIADGNAVISAFKSAIQEEGQQMGKSLNSAEESAVQWKDKTFTCIELNFPGHIASIQSVENMQHSDIPIGKGKRSTTVGMIQSIQKKLEALTTNIMASY